jgi:hypothetical protein
VGRGDRRQPACVCRRSALAQGRNIARDPRVALSVVDHANPYPHCAAGGRVVATRTGADVWDLLDAIARRYTGANYPHRVGVLYEVEIDWEAFTDLSLRRAQSAEPPGR